MLRLEAEDLACARRIDAAPVSAQLRARFFYAGKIASCELVGRIGDRARRRRGDEHRMAARRRLEREAACRGRVARVDIAPDAPELDAGVLKALGEAAEVG